MGNHQIMYHGNFERHKERWTELNIRKRPEARRVAISSRAAKIHTDARPAVRMILAFFVAGAIIVRITWAIWFTFRSRRATVAAVTVEIRRPGGCQYTAQFILWESVDPRKKAR